MVDGVDVAEEVRAPELESLISCHHHPSPWILRKFSPLPSTPPPKVSQPPLLHRWLRVQQQREPHHPR